MGSETQDFSCAILVPLSLNFLRRIIRFSIRSELLDVKVNRWLYASGPADQDHTQNRGSVN